MIGREPKSKRFWLGAVLAAALVVLLLSLGAWQLQRLQWKTALIASLEDQSAWRQAAALSPSQISPADPTPVMLFGNYHPEHAIFVRNGNHMIVYMPFETEDGTFILLRRGIMHLTDLAGQVISQTGGEGPISVVGVPLPQPASVPLVNQADPNSLTWTLLDWHAVETKLRDKKLAPYIIAVLREPQDALQITHHMPQLRNEHMQYAIFWFGMALIAAVLFGRLLLASPRGEKIERDDI